VVVTVGGSRRRPGDDYKYMKDSVIGTLDVIGSVIKEEHVTPHQVTLWMLFLFVWTIMKLFNVTTSMLRPQFPPDTLWWHLPTFIYLLIFLLSLWLTATDIQESSLKLFVSHTSVRGMEQPMRADWERSMCLFQLQSKLKGPVTQMKQISCFSLVVLICFANVLRHLLVILVLQ